MKKFLLLLAAVGMIFSACEQGGVLDEENNGNSTEQPDNGNNGDNGNSGEMIPTNEIWYTSTDGNIVAPYATDVFGANIISNTYENDKGVIVFDAPVTSIGRSAFSDCTSLKEVYCKPTTPPTGWYDMFSYYDSGYKPIGCKIYVPTASVDAYKAADGWRDYADSIVGYDF